MELKLIEKIGLVLKSFFSSFMSIELFIVGLLLFTFLLFGIIKKDVRVKYFSLFLYVLFFALTVIFYREYAVASIDGVIKYFMRYVYFPSLAMYFMIMVITTILLIYTIFTKKINHIKRIINISTFSILYMIYIQFLGIISTENINFTNTSIEIYKNDTILSLVQVSNFILVLWIIYTVFYYLYYYFKGKYKKEEII